MNRTDPDVPSPSRLLLLIRASPDCKAPNDADTPAHQRDAQSKVADLADSPETLANNALVSDCIFRQADADRGELASVAKTGEESGLLETSNSRADLAGPIIVNSLQRNDSALDSMVAGTVGSNARWFTSARDSCSRSAH